MISSLELQESHEQHLMSGIVTAHSILSLIFDGHLEPVVPPFMYLRGISQYCQYGTLL